MAGVSRTSTRSATRPRRCPRGGGRQSVAGASCVWNRRADSTGHLVRARDRALRAGEHVLGRKSRRREYPVKGGGIKFGHFTSCGFHGGHADADGGRR
eukprot:scaffold1041_cov414-Prasinococcus_capsulatus_cf.AAC.4